MKAVPKNNPIVRIQNLCWQGGASKFAHFKTKRRCRIMHSSFAQEPQSFKTGSIFFANLRPLALFCKLLGTFNVENILDPSGKHLKHSWLSFGTLWGVFIYSGSSYLMNLYEKNEWWKFLMPTFFFRIAVSFVMCVVYDRHLPELIRTIETYDAKYRKMYLFSNRVVNLGGYKSYLGKVWALVSALCVVLCTLAIMFSNGFHNLDWFMVFFAFVVIITGIQRHVFVSTFTFFCFYLTLCFHEVCTEWRLAINTAPVRSRQGMFLTEHTHISPHNTRTEMRDSLEDRLESVRLLHCELTKATMQLSVCYGLRLAFYFAWFFIEYLLDLYELAFVSPHRSYTQVFFTIFHLVIITLVATMSGNLAAAGDHVGMELSGTPLTRLSEQCKLLMSVTTYFIVIVQFAPQLKGYTDSFKSP